MSRLRGSFISLSRIRQALTHGWPAIEIETREIIQVEAAEIKGIMGDDTPYRQWKGGRIRGKPPVKSQSPGEAFERQDSAFPDATSRLLDRDQECLESTISAAKRRSIVCLDRLLHPLYQVFDFYQCKHSHRVFLADLGGDSAVLFCKGIWSETFGERQVFAGGNGWSRYWCSRWGLVGYWGYHVLYFLITAGRMTCLDWDEIEYEVFTIAAGVTLIRDSTFPKPYLFLEPRKRDVRSTSCRVTSAAIENLVEARKDSQIFLRGLVMVANPN
ncbi:hypothetical protein KCU61_g255, partial [Aureobasidium melanogenum]